MHKHLRKAIKQAREHEYDPMLDYTLCAVIVAGGAILSIGFNQVLKNSFVDHLVSKVDENGSKPFTNMHAEMSAILQVRNKVDLRGTKMFVAHVKTRGIGMARPCALCECAVKMYGISRVYYTIANNEYGVMNTRGPVVTDKRMYQHSEVV